MKKSMSLGARQEMLASIQNNYQSANPKLKKKIMDCFVAATDYNRKHAIKLLSGKIAKPTTGKKRGQRPTYGEPVIKVLEMLWYAGNQICSKRLVPFIPDLVESLQQHGHIHEVESSEHASNLIQQTCIDENVFEDELVLHSDEWFPNERRNDVGNA